MTKLDKLQKLLEVASENLTRQEFEDNFKVLIDLVRKLKDDNKEKMTEMDTRYDAIVSSVIEKLKSKTDNELSEVKQSIASYCEQEMSAMHEKMEAKMSEMKDGEDGEDADEEEVAKMACEMATEQVKSLIPSVEQVVEQVGLKLPQLGEAMRDGLELLPDGEKLSIDAIQDLREELNKLERRILSGTGKNVYVPSAGGGGGGHTMYVYDLSSSLDGVTKTFNLPAFWRVISVQSSSFPNAFRPTVDYTTDAGTSTITFTSEITASSTLAAGQTVIITYSV